jgi:hypothetical protein
MLLSAVILNKKRQGLSFGNCGSSSKFPCVHYNLSVHFSFGTYVWYTRYWCAAVQSVTNTVDAHVLRGTLIPATVAAKCPEQLTLIDPTLWPSSRRQAPLLDTQRRQIATKIKDDDASMPQTPSESRSVLPRVTC